MAMSILPSQFILEPDTELKSYPTTTFYVDPISKQIRSMVDGLTAMQQAVEIVTSVERYRYSTLSANFGIELTGLIGQDTGYIISEIKRRVMEAFSADDRITGVEDFVFSPVDGDGVMRVTYTVNTVFGAINSGFDLEVA